MFRGPAKMHRKFFERYVDGVGVEVIVRQPVARQAPTSAVDKVLSTRAAVAVGPSSYGEQVTVTAIISTPDALRTNMTWGPALLDALGGTDVMDIVLRAKLADVLSDPEDVLGRTIFHSARDVVYNGTAFKVTGVDRAGMSPESPYVVWVGLKKIGEA